MKTLVLLLILGVMLSGCIVIDESGHAVTRRLSNPDLFDPIREANRELERRFDEGDMLGVAAMYADDAVLISAHGSRTEGREAIDDYWTGIDDPVSWELEVFSVEGTEELAVQRGRSTMRRRRDAEVRTSVVDFIVVWRLEDDGQYRIVVDAYW